MIGSILLIIVVILIAFIIEMIWFFKIKKTKNEIFKILNDDKENSQVLYRKYQEVKIDMAHYFVKLSKKEKSKFYKQIKNYPINYMIQMLETIHIGEING